MVAVLSAQGDTTDDLIQKAEEINPKAGQRDDMLCLQENVGIALCDGD